LRARATAETIASERGLPVEIDRRLREFHFGEWEGAAWPQITARHPELIDASDIIAAYAPPGGETLADVTRRWNDFYAALQAARDERVLVVTHAGMLHAIMRATRPRGAEAAFAGRFRFLPASLTRLRFDEDGVEALSLSDDEHLNERPLS
jgi:broad specificity phosphatase PhoE